jgi:hypothetical protein
MQEAPALCNLGAGRREGHQEERVSWGGGHPGIGDGVLEGFVNAHTPKDGDLAYVVGAAARGCVLNIEEGYVESLEDS